MSRVAKILIFSIMLTAFCTTALADVLGPPDHDWTVWIEGHWFGIAGYPSGTLIFLGWSTVYLEVPFFWIVAAVVITVPVFCFGGLWIVRRRIKSN
jgi:hypothetical protein